MSKKTLRELRRNNQNDERGMMTLPLANLREDIIVSNSILTAATTYSGHGSLEGVSKMVIVATNRNTANDSGNIATKLDLYHMNATGEEVFLGTLTAGGTVGDSATTTWSLTNSLIENATHYKYSVAASHTNDFNLDMFIQKGIIPSLAEVSITGTVTVTGSVAVSNLNEVATLPTGEETYSNIKNDFTVSAQDSSQTFTILANTIDFTPNALGVQKVTRRRNSSVSTLPLTSLSITTGAGTFIVALDDMTDNFTSTDTIGVWLIGPQRTLDGTNDSQKIIEQDPIYNQYLTETPIEVAAGDAETGTTSYYIDMNGYTHLGFQFDITLTAGGSADLSLLGTLQDDGSVASDCSYIDVTSLWASVSSITSQGIFADTSGLGGNFRYVQARMAVTTLASGGTTAYTLYSKKWYGG